MSQPSTRADFLRRFFPSGVPHLWCPPIAHYDENGKPDAARITAHMEQMAPYVGGILIGGSTGDGWEMSDAEKWEHMEVYLTAAKRLGIRVLIGALRTEASQTTQFIEATMDRLKKRSGSSDSIEALDKNAACGFTVCPPKGSALSPPDIQKALESFLSLGIPLSLYQLPQVTQNEMTAETVATLAAKHPHFILFKDTSGADKVVLAKQNLAEVFLVRGAEGDYGKWIKSNGGPYDGFLLSTANCFAKQLSGIISHLDSGNTVEAANLSTRLSSLVKELFDIVSSVPDGNPFANSNKAADHFMAWGPSALDKPGPRLHTGNRLSRDVLEKAAAALAGHQLLPSRGYLER